MQTEKTTLKSQVRIQHLKKRNRRNRRPTRNSFCLMMEVARTYRKKVMENSQGCNNL